jgi:hypothetical protein
MKNTRFSYMYRDASNYKQHGSVVLAGTVTFDQIEHYLQDGENFIASQVGLVDLQPTDTNEDDHVFCEVTADDLEPTDEAPTTTLTAAELVQRFQKAGVDGWDITGAMEKLGIS